jgi:hypothetical protein
MTLVYSAEDVDITPELLKVIDQEARESRGNHYLPELIDNGCRLQWAAVVGDKGVNVYPEVYDRHGELLFPKVKLTKDKRKFVPKTDILLPAAQLRSCTIDPAGAQYQFNADSKIQFATKCSFPVPGDEDFNEELYGANAHYFAVVDKFLGEDLVEFLCTATTKEDEHFQEVLFKLMWDNKGKDPAKFADYLRAKFDDPCDDMFNRPARLFMMFIKTSLVGMDWERFHAKMQFRDMRDSDVEYFEEWEALAETMDPKEKAVTRGAMELMKKEIMQSFSTPNPKCVHVPIVFDKSTPPKPISQTDLYKHVRFTGALVSATIQIEGFRFTKKGVVDMNVMSMHLHVNGSVSKSVQGTGITNKAFGDIAPRALGESSKRLAIEENGERKKQRAITYEEE